MRRPAVLIPSLAILSAAVLLAGGPTIVPTAVAPAAACGENTTPTQAPAAPKNVRIIGGGEVESELEPTSGPSAHPDDAIDITGPIAASGSHTYYEGLLSRSDCVAAYSLRTTAQIDKYKFGLYPVKVTYDAAADAAKWQWNTGDLNGEQMRVPMALSRPATGSSKVLIISDHKWDAAWFTEWMETATTRLDGWKWLQVTDNLYPGDTKQRIWAEPQMRWIGRDPGVLSYFGMRGYTAARSPTTKGGPGVVLNGNNYLADTIGPMLNEFTAKANTWTRAFIEVEQRAGDDHARISYWMADETQDAVPILLNAEMYSGGLNTQFWIEYNTSREARAGGPMRAWARNIVMLKDVADPRSVFSRPGATPTPEPTPAPVTTPPPEPTPTPVPTPTPTPTPVPVPTPEPVPAPGSYPEYEALCAKAGSLCYALRTTAQIDKYKFGLYPVKVTYDAATDAAKWQWNTGDLNGEQMRVPILLQKPAAGSSKLLIISDHKWDDAWFTEWMETATTRLDGWKWLQVTDNITPGETKQHIDFEPQMRWIGRDPGVLAYFGARGYRTVVAPTVKGGPGVVLNGNNYLADTIGPMLNEFTAKPHTWTRACVEVEMRAGEDFARFNYWMSDETRAPVQILSNAQMLSGGLKTQLWIEYNTSRESRAGGPMRAWARNIVVLKDAENPAAVCGRPGAALPAPTPTPEPTPAPTPEPSPTPVPTPTPTPSASILVWGDSIAKGSGLPSPETQAFPALIGQQLGVGIVNKGESGLKASEAVLVADTVLATAGVGTLLLELGAGDALSGAPVAEIQANLSTIITKAKAKGLRVVLCQMDTDTRNGTAYQTAFRALYPALAQQHQIGLTVNLFTGITAADVQSDGLHPNVTGHVKIAANILPAVA